MIAEHHGLHDHSGAPPIVEAVVVAVGNRARRIPRREHGFDARAQLRGLQDGQRISRTDPKTGERVVLEDKDRPGEIAGAQKSVDQWCNKK